MKNFLLTAGAFIATACGCFVPNVNATDSKNGKYILGEDGTTIYYVLEDFEGTAHEVAGKGLNGTDCDTKCEVLEHNDSKQAFTISMAPDGDVFLSGGSLYMYVKVTLPEGKTLADFKSLQVDFTAHRQQDAKNQWCNNKGWHKILILPADEDPTSTLDKTKNFQQLYKTALVDGNGKINVGDYKCHVISTAEEWYDTTNSANKWKESPSLLSDISDTGYNCAKTDASQWSGTFWVIYVVQQQKAGFYLDNLRLVPNYPVELEEITTGVKTVETDAQVKAYGVKGGVIVEGNVVAGVYNLSGACVAQGNGMIELPAGVYVVNAEGKATKVLVK